MCIPYIFHNLSLCKSISTLNFCFSWYLSMALTPAVSQVNDYSLLLFLYGAPRVCLQMEIKHNKNIIRIRIFHIISRIYNINQISNFSLGQVIFFGSYWSCGNHDPFSQKFVLPTEYLFSRVCVTRTAIS